jgi:hypothetical protein
MSDTSYMHFHSALHILFVNRDDEFAAVDQRSPYMPEVLTAGKLPFLSIAISACSASSHLVQNGLRSLLRRHSRLFH